MYKNPIVAFDGSPLSRRALDKGVEMATRLGIPLRTIIVDEGTPSAFVAEAIAVSDARVVEEEITREANWATALAAEATQAALSRGLTLVVEIAEGDAVEAIAESVERHQCDLLIIGLRHHPGLIERLTSKTAQTLAERVECSVLGVR